MLIPVPIENSEEPLIRKMGNFEGGNTCRNPIVPHTIMRQG